jgi:DNA polymerase III delta prime subunit
LITERHRPKYDEFIGDRSVLDKLEICMREGRPCLLYGDPGVGKTSAVYAVAEKLGMRVYELNASDERSREALKEVLGMVRTRGFSGDLVILLDEIDGLGSWDLLRKILHRPARPVVMTANELGRIPKSIQSMCELVYVRHPRLDEVVGRVRAISEAEGIPAKYSNLTISGDVRSSMNAALYGGETYRSIDISEAVERLFRGRPVGLEAYDLNDLVVWILDNASRFVDGRRLYEAIEVLISVDLAQRPEPLSCLPKGRVAKAIFPYFFTRLKAKKEGTG